MRIFVAFLACVLIWGSTWYAIEWQLGYVTKEWSLTYRYAIATLVIFIWCLIKRYRFGFSRHLHIYMAGTGFFLFSANYILVYLGTEYLSSGLVAVCFSLLSFLNIINARLFLGTPFQWKTLIAAVIGVIGLASIFKPEIQTFSFEDQITLGLVICVVATFIASLGNTIVATKMAASVPLIPFNTISLAYGTLFNMMFALFQGDLPSLDPRPEYYIALLYLSVMGTVVAFSLYLWLINQIGVARAAYMAVLTPIVALMISTLMEGFQWTGYAIAGITLVVLGNVLMIKSKKPAPEMH